MPQDLTDEQWNKIRTDVLSRNAIFFLGPRATVNYAEVHHQHDYFQQLTQENPDLITAYHEADGFLVFDRQGNGRNELGGEISDFYRNVPSNEMLQILAEIPANLFVSVTPDIAMQKTFMKMQYPFEQGYFSREPSEELFKPSVENPLIYNLMGFAGDENTLVLSHGALFEMIAFLQKKDSLPKALVDAFSPGIGGGKKSMIFLGFEFDKWYYHFLIYLLRIKEGVSHFAAAEKKPHDAELALYEAHFEATFIQQDLLGFAKELCARIPEEKRRSGQIKKLNAFKEFMLDAISENEFKALCSFYFPKVKREFTDGQTMSQRVDILLEQVQKDNAWKLLCDELKKLNPARHQQMLEPHGC
jgi:hypothetical protein